MLVRTIPKGILRLGLSVDEGADQLLINGKMIGLLRMGAGIECDEKAIEYLNAFFTACINS